MSIAECIFDPVSPLTQLWQDALAAEMEKTGLEPASVIKLVLVGLLLLRKSLILPMHSGQKLKKVFFDGTQTFKGASFVSMQEIPWQCKQAQAFLSSNTQFWGQKRSQSNYQQGRFL